MRVLSLEAEQGAIFMSRSQIGILLTLLVVLVESAQFVYLGGLFQQMSSFQFGFLVFGLTSLLIISYLAMFDRQQIAVAMSDMRTLIAINLAALMTFAAFLLSVQLIEPVITYTISAGVMPITTYVLHRFGWKEGDGFRTRLEFFGTITILLSILFMTTITVLGLSGFVRGGSLSGTAGIALAIIDGVFFTLILAYSSRMKDNGAGSNTILGFRIILYILVAGGLMAAGIDEREPLDALTIAIYVGIGFLLIVPPLYILQSAVGLASTLTMSAIFTLGPIFIFALQMLEGRVAFSTFTLIGLGIYFIGAMLAAFGPIESKSKREARASAKL